MQDDRNQDDADHTDNDPHDEVDEAAALEARKEESREREALLEERRARQTGKGRKRNVPLSMALALLGGALALLMLLVGPTRTLQIFGILEREDPALTSQVGLGVDKEVEDDVRLDFTVPAPPEEVEEKTDPNAALKTQLAALQKELEALQRKKNPGLSKDELRKAMDRYNAKMNAKLDEERERMKRENDRLRAAAAQAEEERRRAMEEAKRQLEMMKDAQSLEEEQRTSSGVIVDDGAKPPRPGPRVSGEASERILNQNEQFLASAADSVTETSLSQPLADPSRTIVQGTIISAVLETAINTELPGNIRAQVMEPVFSFDGRRILMPAGTVLVGQFNNDVQLEQKRVLIAWNRAITPKGQSIALGSTGADKLGRSGTAGNVDNRYMKKLGAAVLVSAIGAVPSALSSMGGNSSSSSGTTINIGGGGGGQGGGGQMIASVGGAIADQGKGFLEKFLNLPPIIRIPQGEEIRVFVNRDLVFR
ncbi:TrbI/VirB10 family protein [Notoacmeibacter sp. MSK16QG-6]|uniref:TrbI/VirB10 family protein n=1 Tax=Notoacmeibacter sp. MSK16QG-6 TaxID=2957982 RepID=UPI00209CD4A6|nr:TrbI/VirB10 family protein [Notoacmeibacter sp. MSK16QG-6]MCP1200605.1 TrbI/VirB10 family protein [Notoacmeibacter sp. MSK16QG-6]